MSRTEDRGFTIMEVLLAVAVAALLLVAATFQIVSLSNIWANRTQSDTFSEHVDGVTRFLNKAFEASLQATVPTFKPQSPGSGDAPGAQQGDQDGDGDKAGKGGSQQPDDSSRGGSDSEKATGVDLARPPGYSNASEPLFHFSLREPPPLLNQAQLRGLPSAEVYLRFDERDGLALIWYSPLAQEDINLDQDDLHAMLLSPFVTKIEYIYRDQDTHDWELEEDLDRRGGDYVLPEFIRLTFEHDDDVQTRLVRIPPPLKQMPVF